jgi:hypothetical protein
MKQQTAVEWLVETLEDNSINLDLASEIIEQAKEIEKKQIIDAWENGYDHGACVNEDKDKYHGIQYFKEKFVN